MTHRSSRQPSRLRRWLRSIIQTPESGDQTSRSLLLEPLERRQLLAGDVEMLSTGGEDQIDQLTIETSSLQGEGELVAEGEPTDDLVEFAKQLTDAGVQFFGAAWCPFCTDQKELFEDGQNYLPFIEVTNPDRTINQVGNDNNIVTFPTWEFPDGTRLTGLLTLQQISDASGIPIPQGETPSFVPIGNQAVGVGSPIHVAVDAYDPDGQPLTVTVTSSNPELLEASVLQGNRSLILSTEGYGDMTFELFEQRAPRPAGRVVSLADQGFYDGLTYHRILNNFVIQGGDPTGTGAGGSPLGDFDDQFHVDLQHNATGYLSYAKTTDDTNDSQFFITEGDSRHLDFNHSIFGFLVEGESNRNAISDVPVDSPNSGRPITNVVIDSGTIVNDTENAVLMLKPISGNFGTADVTVTVTDPDGRTATEIFTVFVGADNQLNNNANPFLGEVADVVAQGGQPATIQLTSTDVEGDAVTYAAFNNTTVNYTTSVDQDNGVVTLTPPAGFVGTTTVQVGVRAASIPVTDNNSSVFDLQTINVTFTAGSLSGVALDPASDTGASNSDGITSAQSLTFNVSGVADNALVELLVNGNVVDEIDASGSTTPMTTNAIAQLGNGTFSVTARQRVGNNVSSETAPITITFDSSAPATLAIGPAAQAIADHPYRSDLDHVEEGNGLTYSLSGAPAGMTIDPQTGVISWTPTADDATGDGNHAFDVVLTDQAGNTRNDNVQINVGDADTLVTYGLNITDLNGNELSSLTPGQEFLLTINVNDDRGFFVPGFANATLDVLYDPKLAEPVGNLLVVTNDNDNISDSPFTFHHSFTANPPRTLSLMRGDASNPGIIDQLHAFSVGEPGFNADFVSIHMRALDAGTLVFAGDPAEDNFEVLLHGIDNRIEVNDVDFGNVSIEIVSTFRAVDNVFNFDEDSTNNPMDVLANDELLTPGTVLSITGVSDPAAGTVSIVNGQSLQYTPTANFNGTDQFTYTVQDQNGNSATATVTIGVQPINDPPLAVDDSFEGDSEIRRNSTNNVLEVLLNDGGPNDPDHNDNQDDLRIVEVGVTSAGGTVSIASSGSHLLYTPPVDYSGPDSFTYTISDRLSNGLTSTANVTLNVSAFNTVSETFTVDEDAPEASFDVISNDEQANPDDTLQLIAVDDGSAGGTTLFNNNNELLYQPAANFNGQETVVYTLRNQDGDTARETVTFTVNPINDPPVAENDSDTVGRTASNVTINVVSNDSGGVDGTEALSIRSFDGTNVSGSLSISNDRQSIIYTPDGSFTGTEVFTYVVEDAGGATAEASVTVEVLDFIPRDFRLNLSDLLSNVVENNSFLRSLSGLQIRLDGQDEFGNPVSHSQIFNASADAFEFEDQAPGQYQLTIPAIPFLAGGEQQVIDINSSFSDGSMDVPVTPIGSLRSEYVSIRDAFALTPRRSVVMAAVAPGGTAVFNNQLSTRGGLMNVSVSLNADSTVLTIRGEDTNGNNVENTLSVDDSRVEVRGTDGIYTLYRIDTEAFDPDPTTQQINADPAQAQPAISPLSQPGIEAPITGGISNNNDDDDDDEIANDAFFSDLGSSL